MSNQAVFSEGMVGGRGITGHAHVCLSQRRGSMDDNYCADLLPHHSTRVRAECVMSGIPACVHRSVMAHLHCAHANSSPGRPRRPAHVIVRCRNAAVPDAEEVVLCRKGSRLDVARGKGEAMRGGVVVDAVARGSLVVGGAENGIHPRANALPILPAHHPQQPGAESAQAGREGK